MKPKLYEPKARVVGEGPGFWINVDSVDRITAKCDHAAKLLALFYILNMLMSDERARSFTATYAHLAHRSGIKAGAIKRHLAGLEYVGVIVAKELPDKASARITITGKIKFDEQ
jgi:hypothetical protein